MKWTLEKKISLGFGFAPILLIIIGVISYHTTLELKEAEAAEEQTRAVLTELEQISLQLEDAEIGELNYLLTGQATYLEPYHATTRIISDEIKNLRQLTADNPDQQREIDVLELIIATKLAQIKGTIDLRTNQGFEPALQMVLTRKGSAVTGDIRQAMAALRNDQRQVLEQQSAESEESAWGALHSIMLSSMLAVVVVAFATFIISRDIRERQRVEKELRRSRDQLAIILQGVADGITVQDSAGQLIYANDAATQALGDTLVPVLLDAPAGETGQKFEIMDEMGRRLPLAALPGPQVLRGEQSTETILRFRMVATDDERWMVVKATPVVDEGGRLQFAISIFHDITERMQTYQTLERRVEERTHEIERRRQVAEGLRDIMTVLNSNRPLDDILESIIAQACRLLVTDAGAVYRLEGRPERLGIQASDGLGVNDAALLNQSNWRIIREAVTKRRPVASSHAPVPLSDASDLLPHAPSEKSLAHPTKQYAAILAVPLVVKDDVYGAIALYYHQAREFSNEEIELAIALGDHAALAIENARLRVQAEQTAIAAERSRLARDLHDAVTQTLFSTSLIADVLPRLWERNRDEGQRRLGELRQLTRGALAEMRALLLELRPATLVEVGLDELLRLLAEAIISRARVPVTLTVEGQCHPPPDVQIAFYRIAQEALNNMVRHAGARHAIVQLRSQPALEMHISDDGQGFDLASVAPEHLGLAIMRERAETIGAELRIVSQPGSGTQITVTWPGESVGAGPLHDRETISISPFFTLSGSGTYE